MKSFNALQWTWLFLLALHPTGFYLPSHSHGMMPTIVRQARASSMVHGLYTQATHQTIDLLIAIVNVYLFTSRITPSQSNIRAQSLAADIDNDEVRALCVRCPNRADWERAPARWTGRRKALMTCDEIPRQITPSDSFILPTFASPVGVMM